MEKKGSTFSFLPDLHTIFVKTNIDTHLAMVVSLYDTIRDVKSKIIAEHALCFQEIGEISIRAIKMKHRGFFYTLADSMCVWNVFHGFKGSWIFCIDAMPMCSVKSPEIAADEVTNYQPEHHFNGVAISPCEMEKVSGPDGKGSHNSTFMRRDHESSSEMLIDQSKDDYATINGMHVTCNHKTKSGKRSKISGQDNIVGNQSQHDLVEKKRGKDAEEGFHGDYAQNHPVNQHKKRKRKSSKSFEEAHLSVPSETLVPQSLPVTLVSHSSGEHGDASIYLEKCPVGPNNNLSLLTDGRHIRMAPGIASSFEVTNQKEKDEYSMETCMVVFSSGNRESIEDQILQANPQDQKEKHVIMAQETNAVVRHKETEDIRISSQVHYELPFKTCCSTDALIGPSSIALEHQEVNKRAYGEFDAAKCMTELNPKEDEAGTVGERKGPPLEEKFSYEDQDTTSVFEKFLVDEHQCLDIGSNAVANLEGADKDKSLIQVNSKVIHKSHRRKKKLSTESSRACESTEINGDQENFNSAQIIKPADQKSNVDHCVDTVSSSSKHSQNVYKADSPTELVHSASHKHQDTSHVGAANDAIIKYCKSRNTEKPKSTYKSGKRKAKIRSNSSEDEVSEYHKLDKKLQDSETKSHFQLPKSDILEIMQEKITEDGKDTPSFPLDGGIVNMISNDGYVRCKSFNSSTSNLAVANDVDLRSSFVSPSEEMAIQVASCHSTEDTPCHLRRFKVIRKIPIRRSKCRTDNL